MTMSPKKIILTVALMGSAIAIGIAWRAWAAADSAEAGRARVGTLQAKTETELRQVNEVLAATERAHIAAEAALAALRDAKPAAPPKETGGVAKSPTENRGVTHPAELLAKDPKLQVMQLAAERARFETTYGPMLKKLQLSAEQVAKLRDAHVRSEEQKADIAAIAREQKLTRDDPVLAKLNRDAFDELRAVQMEVLRPDGYAVLQDYEHTLPARAIVERFAGAMAIADKPITAGQAERLTEIVAQASGAAGRDRIDLGRTDWSQVDERAASVLSAEQLALFTRIEPVGGGQSRWMAQFNRAMQEARKSVIRE
jgi:hypothetical protein